MYHTKEVKSEPQILGTKILGTMDQLQKMNPKLHAELLALLENSGSDGITGPVGCPSLE